MANRMALVRLLYAIGGVLLASALYRLTCGDNTEAAIFAAVSSGLFGSGAAAAPRPCRTSTPV